jgi:cellulose synthase operon protein C
MARRGAERRFFEQGDAACLRWKTLAALLAVLVAASMAHAQPPSRAISKFHPDASSSAERLLRNAASQAAGGQWSEALNLYQRVINQYGDTVAEAPPEDGPLAPGADRTRTDSRLYVDAREYCQRRIAALPAEARALYRNRVDPQAERWFQDGSKTRDRDLLRKVVDQAFCSSWGDDALELMGDLAFQDGQIAEALLCYRRLVPDFAGEAPGLMHPDPSIDLARVAAKILLCRAALGETPPSPDDLKTFRARYPKAEGVFAGRDGLLADSLSAALEQDRLAAPTPFDSRWPTLGGGPTRTRIAPKAFLVGSFMWKVQLKEVRINQTQADQFGMGGGRRMPYAPQNVGADRQLAYHPIVLGDQALVCDQSQVFSIPLNIHEKGESGGPSDLRSIKLWETVKSDMQDARSSAGMPRFTLTAAGDRVFARLGPPGGRGSNPISSSSLIAVRKSTEGKLLWRKTPMEILSSSQRAGQATFLPAFEGTPVADLRAVYVAMTLAGPMTATYVVCLDAETGVVRWMKKVGEAAIPADNALGGAFGAVEIGHRLLTLDGPTVYYQTNLGAVVALEAATGSVRWIATYPSQDFNVERPAGSPRPTRRDLNPAVVHEGLVIVAPDDAAALFAFHAASGRLAWKCADPKVSAIVHVLGVAKGRLIATGDQVFSINVKTGKVESYWPDGSGAMSGFGRGLMAGNYIYWPTKDYIHILDQNTGARAADQESIKLSTYGLVGGNLAMGEGYLVIAGLDLNTIGNHPPLQSIVVFSHNTRRIQQLKDDIAKGIDPGPNSLILGRAHEAEGELELALAALGQAVNFAKPADFVDGESLEASARAQQYRILMTIGDKAVSEKRWGDAVGRFDQAAQAARLDRDRLAARLRQADCQVSSGEPAAAVSTLQGVLADYRIRGLGVTSEDGQRTVRADLLVADRLSTLLKRHGAELYEAYDRQAIDLLKQGKAEHSPRLIESIGATYPVARIVPEAYLTLGALHESLERPVEAARAYKQLVVLASASDSQRARALCGLARAFEAQRLWGPARESYERALSKYPDVKLVELGADATVASYVAGQLAKEPLARLAGGAGEPRIPLPLSRRWERTLPNHVVPMRAEGSPPTPESGRVFLAERNTIRPLDPRSGGSSWRFDLQAEPVWVGYLADHVLVASSARLVGLGLEKGDVLWEARADSPRAARARLNPFAPKDAKEVKDAKFESRPSRFRGFQIIGNRVLCRLGDKEILAIDGDSGQLDWSFAPASGRLGDHALLSRDRIVMQAVRPNSSALLVLDPDSGRCRELARPADEQEWARDPLRVDDDHVAVATSGRSVALVDVNTGKDSWVHHHLSVPRLSPHAAPRLFGEAGRLLALFDGNELASLNSENGRVLWSATLGNEDLSEWPASCAMDADRFYCATNSETGAALTAYALADGKPAWSRHLMGAESGWAIALTDHYIAAHPNPTRVLERSLETLPLAFFRGDDGRLVQRLTFPASVSELTVGLASRDALVATQSNLWSLGERPTMDADVPPR